MALNVNVPRIKCDGSGRPPSSAGTTTFLTATVETFNPSTAPDVHSDLQSELRTLTSELRAAETSMAAFMSTKSLSGHKLLSGEPTLEVGEALRLNAKRIAIANKLRESKLLCVLSALYTPVHHSCCAELSRAKVKAFEASRAEFMKNLADMQGFSEMSAVQSTTQELFANDDGFDELIGGAGTAKPKASSVGGVKRSRDEPSQEASKPKKWLGLF